MTGITDEAFMRSSVAMTVTPTQGLDGVLAEVAITNVAAGHHIPTDSPMRNMILVVTARDAQGNILPHLGDQIVPEWGGTDRETYPTQSLIPDYAGLPGKGFAKVLEDWDGTAPAPQWRNGIRIASDTRIPARTTDRSTYSFAAPADGQPASIEARLIFRRAFKPWMDAKGWNEPDLVLAEIHTTAVSKTPDEPPASPATPAPLFPPSLATTSDGQRLRSADVAAPQECAACHPDVERAWQASGHAEATTGPLYRAWFKAADQTTQGEIGPFCAGCHTPAGLLSGQIRSRWSWSGRELRPLDAAAQSGVTCDACHAIVDTTGLSNGAYVLDPARRVASAGPSACPRAVSAAAATETQSALPTTQYAIPEDASRYAIRPPARPATRRPTPAPGSR